MKIDWSSIKHAIALSWFYARNHLTKALGLVAVGVGYAIQHQAEWILWFSDKDRGAATRYIGFSVFALGLYNQFFPPVKPSS